MKTLQHVYTADYNPKPHVLAAEPEEMTNLVFSIPFLARQSANSLALPHCL